MNTITVDSFYVIGISTRTSNEPGKAEADIPQLWEKFMSENPAAQIPGKIGEEIYCLYTDYESDFTKPYTVVIGPRVNNLDAVPAGFTGVSIDTANYVEFIATGDLGDNIIFKQWQEIWKTDLSRAYTTYYEVYGSKSHDFHNPEVSIFIGVK